MRLFSVIYFIIIVKVNFFIIRKIKMHNRYKADYNQRKGPARQQTGPKQSIYGVTTHMNDLPRQAKNQGRDGSNGPYIRSSNPNNKKKIGSQSRINGTSF